MMLTMYYIYVLLSLKDGKMYTGYTSELSQRIKQNNEGSVKSTQYRCPFILIYFEACLSQKDAIRRERY
ncbi:MAG: GIY-YIG nuclease family protein [bacterium]